MAKKNTLAKVFAFIALFGIVLGIVGTGALFIFGNSSNEKTEKVKTINPKKLQELIDSSEIKTEIQTGATK